VGSDGGGSIRIPSSLCGVFGIKTSRGRVSFAPDPNHFFSVLGPIAGTVADAAALLDVMAGYATGDAFWAPPPDRSFAEEANRPPGSLRIGATAESLVAGVVVDEVPRVGFDETIGLLEALGHTVEEAAPEWDPMTTLASVPVFGAEFASRKDLPPLDTLHADTRHVVEIGRGSDGPTVMGALDEIFRLARRAVAFWDSYDVLLTPTVAITAPLVGEFQNLADDPEGVFRYLALAAFTAPFNLTGQPAVNIPAGFDAAGMPMGIQLVGRPGDEATLIRLSAQVEAARPWRESRPSLG